MIPRGLTQNCFTRIQFFYMVYSSALIELFILNMSRIISAEMPKTAASTYFSIENIPIGNLQSVSQNLKRALGSEFKSNILEDVSLNRVLVETPSAFTSTLEKFIEDQSMETMSLFLAKCPAVEMGLFILPLYKRPSTSEIDSIIQEIDRRYQGSNIEYDQTMMFFRFNSFSKSILETSINANGHNRLNAFPTYPNRFLIHSRGDQKLLLEDIKKTMLPKEWKLHNLFTNVHAAYFESIEDAKLFCEICKYVQESMTLPVLTIYPGCNIMLFDLKRVQIQVEALVNGIKDFNIKQPIVTIDSINLYAFAILPECAYYLMDIKMVSVRLRDFEHKDIPVIYSPPLKALVKNFSLNHWDNLSGLEQELRADWLLSSKKWSIYAEKCTYIIECESKALFKSLLDASTLYLPSGEIVVEKYVGDASIFSYDVAWYLSIFQKEFVDVCTPQRNLNRLWIPSECKRYLQSWRTLHKDSANVSERRIQKSVYISALLDSIGASSRGCLIETDLSSRAFDIHLKEVAVEVDKPTSLLPTKESVCPVHVKVEYALHEYAIMERASLNPVLVLISSQAKSGVELRNIKPGHELDITVCTGFCKKIPAKSLLQSSLLETEVTDLTSSILYYPKTTLFRLPMDEGFRYLDAAETCNILKIIHQHPPLAARRSKDISWIKEVHVQISYALWFAASQGHQSLIICMDSHQAIDFMGELCEIIRDSLMLVGGGFKRTVIAIHPSETLKSEKGNRLETCKKFFSTPIKIFLKEETVLSTDICHYGHNCSNQSLSHIQKKCHPFKCELSETCPHLESPVHKAIWNHVKLCPYEGRCRMYDEEEHCKFNTHPQRCQLWHKCTDESDDHVDRFLHPPACKFGDHCSIAASDDHWKNYRHIKMKCRDGTFCQMYNDSQHTNIFSHPFLPICAKSPALCRDESEAHMKGYSHICCWGRQCKELEDPTHLKRFVHIVRPECKTENCDYVLDDSHCLVYSHRGIRDVRLYCSYGDKCRKKAEPAHYREYHHTIEKHPSCESKMLNDGIDFARNKIHIESSLSRHKKPVSHEIINWFAGLKPIHRCSVDIFESIVSHGMLMSLESMSELSNPEYAAKEAMHSPVILDVLQQTHTHDPRIHDNKLAILEKFILSSIMSHTSQGDEGFAQYHKVDAEAAKSMLRDHKFTNEHFERISQKCKAAADLCVRLKHQPKGIAFGVDKEMGTDRHVFSVLGPHLGGYYGAISIVFKQEILYHPDTNFTCCAGTSFKSGRATEGRPWIVLAGQTPRLVFDTFKMHSTLQGWQKTIAEQLISYLSSKGPCHTVSDVVNTWESVDSHFVIECHLPSFIPISYVHKIIMPKNIYARVSEGAKSELRRIFPDFEERVLRLTQLDQANEKENEPATKETARRAYPYFKHRIEMTGLCFAVGPKKPALIPNQMSSSQKYLRFRANGRSFFIYLTENDEISPNPGRAVTIFINTDAEDAGVYLFEGIVRDPSPAISKKTGYTVCQHFNSNLNPADFISYEVQVDSGSIKMYHTGHWFYTNSSRFDVPLKGKDSFRRVHFLAQRGVVQLVDVCIQSKPTMTPKADIPKISSDADAKGKARSQSLGSKGNSSSKEKQQESQKADSTSSPGLLEQARELWNHLTGQSGSGPTPSDKDKHKSKSSSKKPSKKSSRRKENESSDESSSSHSAPPSSPSKRGPSRPSASDSQDSSASCSPSPSPSPPRRRSSTQSGRRKENASSSTPQSRDQDDSLLAKCIHGVQCTEFHDALHRSEFQHKINKPCRDGHLCPFAYADGCDHNQKYSHPCRFGVGCRDLAQANSAHNKIYYHIPIPRCDQGRKCSLLQDIDHRHQYSHHGMPDILIPCRYGLTCRDIDNANHFRSYSHE
eukprot:TRINITY_DN3162_c0_g1_i2.p1 TRINITY_DN3162_c0_g1~~TRINITY_DN3162_c0_g1_i2.p1  ORF type:complete len:1864 (+),score=286.85 TRINITY_DN3162_c0_g1_i2:1390-6981(+)